MSEYDDAVLADSPLFYGKCEDLSGTVLTDSSGNGRHGVIDTSTAILGIPGPIETDGTSLGVAEKYGEIAVVSGTALDVRDNFTLEMWGRVEELIGDHGLLTRLGQWGLNGSFAVGFNSGSIFARISTAADVAETHSPTSTPLSLLGQ
jgi:hypothetical protein